MSSALRNVVTIVALLCLPQVAFPLPPDRVRGSQIPALRETRNLPSSLTGQTNFDLLNSPAAKYRQAPQDPYEALSKAPTQVEQYREEQQQIWESPEMVEARSYITEFCRRSARSTSEEGEQFLTQLSKLSPDDMQAWLDRYLARRQMATDEREVGDLARQVQLGQAIQQQHAARSVYSHVKQQQSQFAASNPGGFPTSNMRAWQMRATYAVCDRCAPCRVQMLTGSGGLTAAAYVNQMNNPYYAMAAAAAASTPGDLLRNDPRNYMRGDVSDVSNAASLPIGLPQGPDLSFSLPAPVASPQASVADEDSPSP